MYRYRLEGDDFLKNIAIRDESWVHHYDPENKSQSMEYRHTASPNVKEFKTVPSATLHVHQLLGCEGRALHGISV
jgi:hypothetical protein